MNFLNKWKILYYCLGLIVLLMSNICFAAIVIAPNTVISSDTSFSNDTLDMSNGSFIITNNATLTIEKCIINGTISSSNPFLVRAQHGNITLKDNEIHVTASGITPTQEDVSVFQVVRIDQGMAEITGNSADVDQSFSVAFLLSDETIPNSGFNVSNNSLNNFHGGLYLLNNDTAQVNNNSFLRVSFSNIFFFGHNSTINGNKFLFSGNFSEGEAIDILNSDHVMVADNLIRSGSCIGIAVGNSHDITIDGNNIADQLTYGMSINNEVEFKHGHKVKSFLFQWMAKHHIKSKGSNDIIITNNYLVNNRFGLNAGEVDHMTVSGNYFVQRFTNAGARKFWTDNTNLLLSVTNLIWTNNFYKEAYTQVNGGDDTPSLQIVTFPASGGVVL